MYSGEANVSEYMVKNGNEYHLITPLLRFDFLETESKANLLMPKRKMAVTATDNAV